MGRCLAPMLLFTLLAPAVAEEPLAVRVLNALEAAASANPVARGKGTHEHVREGEVLLRAEFDFENDREKHFLDIRFQPNLELPTVNERVVMKWTEKAIHVIRFSPRIRPAGCEGDIYESGFSQFRIGTRLAFMPWALVQTMLGDPGALSDRKPEFRLLEDGRIEGSYGLNGKSRVTFVADPGVGDNIVQVEARSGAANGDGGDRLLASYEASWRKIDGRWTCTKLVNQRWRNGEVRDRIVVSLSEIDAKAKPASFRIPAIQECPGARTIDRRPGAVQRILR